MGVTWVSRVGSNVQRGNVGFRQFDTLRAVPFPTSLTENTLTLTTEITHWYHHCL